jgi:CRP/FNR family transcriptional regulator, cyclic AMP receptor protein
LTEDGQEREAFNLFGAVSEAVRERLAAACPALRLARGQTLFQRGDPGGTMYLVQSGRIEISVMSELGRKISLNIIGPGACFGEIGLIDGRDRTATAVALEASSVVPVTRKVFFEAAAKNPELSVALMQALCERLRWMADAVEDYALLSLERRLARRLLLLARNFAKADGGIEISQRDLADFAGATREAVNKILIGWQEAGLISLKRRLIYLARPEALDKLAHEAEG